MVLLSEIQPRLISVAHINAAPLPNKVQVMVLLQVLPTLYSLISGVFFHQSYWIIVTFSEHVRTAISSMLITSWGEYCTQWQIHGT